MNSQASATPVILNLPEEILELISSLSDRYSLLALSLSCRAFHIAAESSLYSHLLIRSRDPELSLSDAAKYRRPLLLYLRTILRRPALCRFLHQLEYTGRDYDDKDHMSWTPFECNRFRQLLSSNLLPQRFYKSTEILEVDLNSLSTCEATFAVLAFIILLSANLQRLRLHVDSMLSAPLQLASKPSLLGEVFRSRVATFHCLRSVHVEWTGESSVQWSLDPRLWKSLFRLPAMQTLHLSLTGAEFRTCDKQVPVCPSLKKLDVEYAALSEYSLAALLEATPQLSSLLCYANTSWKTQVDCQLLKQCLDQTEAHLECLALCFHSRIDREDPWPSLGYLDSFANFARLTRLMLPITTLVGRSIKPLNWADHFPASLVRFMPIDDLERPEDWYYSQVNHPLCNLLLDLVSHGSGSLPSLREIFLCSMSVLWNLEKEQEQLDAVYALCNECEIDFDVLGSTEWLVIFGQSESGSKWYEVYGWDGY